MCVYKSYNDVYVEHGTIYTVRVLSRADMNRQLVKSQTCTVTIPEYQLTIPPSKGQLTTIEGILRDVVADLCADQPLRRVADEDTYKKIQSLIDSFNEILGDEDEDDSQATETTKEMQHIKPFTLILDDPAGNSFLEFIESMADPKWNLRTYNRTRKQNADLGLVAADDDKESRPDDTLKQLESLEHAEDIVGGGFEGNNEEIYVFPGICSSCGAPLDTMMKKVNIPYFKVEFV